MRLLKIEDVVDMERRDRLAEMMIANLRFEDPDFELPDWAKGWPNSFSNFWIDYSGIVWGYCMGDVYAGANGPMKIRLSWEQLRPVLRKDFVLPTE